MHESVFKKRVAKNVFVLGGMASSVSERLPVARKGVVTSR
jgi:hypothetical protein